MFVYKNINGIPAQEIEIKKPTQEQIKINDSSGGLACMFIFFCYNFFYSSLFISLIN
jgi:hypothetical protein